MLISATASISGRLNIRTEIHIRDAALMEDLGEHYHMHTSTGLGEGEGVGVDRCIIIHVSDRLFFNGADGSNVITCRGVSRGVVRRRRQFLNLFSKCSATPI